MNLDFMVNPFAHRINEVDDHIRTIREWLEANRSEYQRAMESYNDLSWCQDALDVCRNALLALESYDPKEDRPETAQVVLGKCLVSMQSVFNQLAILEQWEDMNNQIKALKGTPVDEVA